MFDGEELALGLGNVLVALERRQENGAERSLADPMVHVEDGTNVGNLLLELGDLLCEHIFGLVKMRVIKQNWLCCEKYKYCRRGKKLFLVQLTVFLDHAGRSGTLGRSWCYGRQSRLSRTP